ncbi:MAG: tetratricopeptide repeat protein [Treponema sp.]|jgi:tetratricopeptide (TPR) repeat protein|nr:tetratricopeptide repeat protein [Treponema sp.]
MKAIKVSLILFFLIVAGVSAQNSGTFTARYNNGVALYNSGHFYEAAAEFRCAQEIAASEYNWAGATYWVILSQLAYTDYGSALIDMQELNRKAPNSIFNRDMVYHRGRIYFNQGYFEDALLLFRQYIDSVAETGEDAQHRKAAAYYWMAECLFAMGQFDDAERFYAWVLASYPESPKREVSSYRIDLIRQKKIESELLALLQWSHEEALRTSEEHQRKLRTYEFTINTYQRRIAELTQAQGAGVTVPRTEEPEPQITPQDFEEIPFEDFMSGVTQDYHEELLEKARQLGENIQRLIQNSEGETW